MITDRQKTLIASLRNNGRAKIHTLAKRENIATSSLTDMLHRMENAGVIHHVTHVAFDKIGYPVRMFIAIKTDNHNKTTLRNFLTDQKNINTLHEINSGYDYHFEALFKNQKEAQEFLDELEEKNTIIYKHVYNVIDTIHHEKFMTDKDHYE
jgi:DNA-binding Lrp family transcriptional regulator